MDEETLGKIQGIEALLVELLKRSPDLEEIRNAMDLRYKSKLQSALSQENEAFQSYLLMANGHEKETIDALLDEASA